MRTSYYEAFLVVWLRSLFFRDVVPYYWVIGSQYFKMKWSHLQWSEVQSSNDVALHPGTETSTFNMC